MKLIRLITLQGLIHNVRVFAKHIGTKQNFKSDGLSRMQFDCFWSLAPSSMCETLTKVPTELLPMPNVW